MLNYNLNSCESARKLLNMCDKYRGKMEIDIIHGRYTIDAYSVLGVHVTDRTCSIAGTTNRR